MKKYMFILLLCNLWLLSGCEESLTIDLPAGDEELIVEGHIEQNSPPLVILTKSVPVFASVSAETLEGAFVHNAQVKVIADGQEYTLQEVAVTSLSDELKEQIAIQFGIRPTFLNSGSFPFYIYTTNELKGEIGKNYQLRISYSGKILTATTSIPNLNPIDSLWFAPHPDPNEDSLKILMYRYVDPDTIGNSVRYFTKRNQEPYFAGLFGSVFNDELINGGTISFPLDRGEPKGQKEIDDELYGYFGKGDTVTVRWAAIDLAHFRFWNTLESEQNSNGSPIGSPNITRSNINGGLGIWGGYGVTYHTLIIE